MIAMPPISSFFSSMIEPVVYNQTGGESVTVDAIVSRGAVQQEDENIVYPASITIDAGQVINNPDGDTVTFDSFEWDVTGFLPTAGRVVVYVERRVFYSKRATQ